MEEVTACLSLATAPHLNGWALSFHADLGPTSTSSSAALRSCIALMTGGSARTQSGHHGCLLTGSRSAEKMT